MVLSEYRQALPSASILAFMSVRSSPILFSIQRLLFERRKHDEVGPRQPIAVGGKIFVKPRVERLDRDASRGLPRLRLRLQVCNSPTRWVGRFRQRSLSRSQIAAAVRSTGVPLQAHPDRKSTRLNSSHLGISYAVFCLKK